MNFVAHDKVIDNTPIKKGQIKDDREILRARDYMKKNRNMDNLIVMKFGSVPAGAGAIFRTLRYPKSIYHIEYVIDVFQSLPNVTTKFLYLERNFFKTVLSHYQLDGGFVPHAKQMEKFAKFIRSEFKLIEARRPNLWRRVHYEWLLAFNKDQFLVFVNALIEFLEWKDCTEVNIADLQGIIRPGKRKTGLHKHLFNFSMALDWRIDIPPLLNTSGWNLAEEDYSDSSDLWLPPPNVSFLLNPSSKFPSNPPKHNNLKNPRLPITSSAAVRNKRTSSDAAPHPHPPRAKGHNLGPKIHRIQVRDSRAR